MANGGIIGPTNVTSRGKDTVTNKTSSGDVTLQSGTRVVQALIVAGGGVQLIMELEGVVLVE